MADNTEAVKNTENVTETAPEVKKDTVKPTSKKTVKATDKKNEKKQKDDKLAEMLKNRTPFEAKLIKGLLKGKYGYADKCLLSKDKDVVLKTMLIIGECRADKYVDPIAQVVCDAADPVFRKTAADSLALMKSNRALFQLIKRMEIEKDPEVLTAITNAVRSIHNKEAEAE